MSLMVKLFTVPTRIVTAVAMAPVAIAGKGVKAVTGDSSLEDVAKEVNRDVKNACDRADDAADVASMP